MHSKKESIMKYKILYTIIIFIIYMIGKSIPLYKIDLAAYMDKSISASDLLFRTISGDIYQCSLLALGISPYMISTMVVQIVSLLVKSDKRSKISPKKMGRFTLVITLLISIFQAIMKVRDLQFTVSDNMLNYAMLIAFVELIAGSMLIMWLVGRCKRFGFGGQSVLILTNIIDSIRVTVFGYDMERLMIPLMLAGIAMIITVIMENSEKRIPVQRISIHNIYADKNYMAIKMNPIGVMPAMFSTTFFILPQLLITLLLMFFENNTELLWCANNMSMEKPLGIVTYVVILYLLNILFSRAFINPREIMEQYLKSGDSIVNLHAGKETRKYLSRTINRISFFSATIMSGCLLLPIILNYYGYIESELVALPSMAMMITGLWCNLYREYEAIRNLQAYKPFI